MTVVVLRSECHAAMRVADGWDALNIRYDILQMRIDAVTSLMCVCFVRYTLAKLKRELLVLFGVSVAYVQPLCVCVCLCVVTWCIVSVWEAEDRDVLAAALESLLGSFCETELFDVVEVRFSLSISLSLSVFYDE